MSFSDRKYREVPGVVCSQRPEKVVVIDKPNILGKPHKIALSTQAHFHYGKAHARVECTGTLTDRTHAVPQRPRSVKA